MRTIATHIDALRARGARAVPGADHVLEAPDGLKSTSIYLYEASVTGTETALLAAAAAPGVSEIRHAACEPHVVELCAFLREMGVGVTGGGTTTIRVEGGGPLHGAEHRLWGDYVEAGSWAVVAAVTGGEVRGGIVDLVPVADQPGKYTALPLTHPVSTKAAEKVL